MTAQDTLSNYSASRTDNLRGRWSKHVDNNHPIANFFPDKSPGRTQGHAIMTQLASDVSYYKRSHISRITPSLGRRLCRCVNADPGKHGTTIRDDDIHTYNCQQQTSHARSYASMPDRTISVAFPAAALGSWPSGQCRLRESPCAAERH